MSPIFFNITSIDPLGQGVAHTTEGTVFIPRTLPGESGIADIWRSKQKVHFGQVVKWQTLSEQRIAPQCPHYDQCGGCHFQHTSYSQELQFKAKTLGHLLRHLYHKDITLIPAVNRFFYRNRLQLHYQITHPKNLGMIGLPPQSSIVAVPECQLSLPQLKNTLNRWYQGEAWEQELPAHAPSTGHVEIYQHPLKGQGISWNAPYADGGFAQVNDAMNAKLCALIAELAKQWPGEVVDLFGGNGNLTAQLTDRSVLVVDQGPTPSTLLPHQHFLSLNLYQKNACEQLNQYQKKWRSIGPQASPLGLILDPPRSGLKNLIQFTSALRPTAILYVSCHPMMLARDLASISHLYHLQKIYLLDLFPASYHFETVAYLELIA